MGTNYTGNSTPTLSNAPASGWTTDAVRQSHVGNTYLVTGSGGTAGNVYAFEEYQSPVVKSATVPADVVHITDGGNNLNAVSLKTSVVPDQAGEPSAKGGDSVPYTFKASPNSGENSETDLLVGGTIAWNQLIQNGNFANGDTGWLFKSNLTHSVANNALTVHKDADADSGYIQARNITWLTGHKYLIMISAAITNGQFRIVPTNSSSQGMSQTFSTSGDRAYIWDAVSTVVENCSFQLYSVNSGAIDITFKNAMMFDLTQMFGATIADYIYSLETANAGAGVAFFRKLFPKPYYAYNAGTLLSVNASKHKMVGFNAWDEEWESGTINTSGQTIADPNYIRSKNYIPVLPNTGYFLKTGTSLHRIFFYDVDKTFISFSYSTSTDGKLYTTPSNCYYVKFRPESTYGTTYKNDCCLNLSWDGERNGEYEAYSAHEYALDSDLTLRGIPKLSASNELYYDGDTYEADGTVTRKYGIVTYDGSSDESWGLSNGVFYITLNGYARAANITPICDKLTAIPTVTNTTAMSSADDNSITVQYNTSYNRVFVKRTASADVSAFKTWLASNNVNLVYELATPTEESADPYQNPQIVDDFGTEEYVVTEQSGVAVPVGHKSYYYEAYPISGHSQAKVYREATHDTSASPQITMSLGSTVYGGEIDWTNGKLKTTYGILDLGSVNWSAYNNGGQVFEYNMPIAKTGTSGESSNAYCETLTVKPYGSNGSYAGQDNVIWIHTAGTIRVRCDWCATAAEFKTFVSGVHFVYPLMTPTETTLTAKSLATLNGQNYVWTDCGQVTKFQYQSNQFVPKYDWFETWTMPKITRNNGTVIVLPYPQEYTPEIYDVDASTTGRNAAGTMIRDRVARKHKFNYKFPPLSRADATEILGAVQDVSFTLTTASPETGAKTNYRVYVGDRSLPVYWMPTHDNVSWLYSSLSLNLIEM